MSKTPVHREEEAWIFSLDRREFIMAGLAVAATAMLPRLAFGAPAKQSMVSARRSCTLNSVK
jgi:hypothetical protein